MLDYTNYEVRTRRTERNRDRSLSPPPRRRRRLSQRPPLSPLVLVFPPLPVQIFEDTESSSEDEEARGWAAAGGRARGGGDEDDDYAAIEKNLIEVTDRLQELLEKLEVSSPPSIRRGSGGAKPRLTPGKYTTS